MAYVPTPDGTEIFYNDWGAGRPVVLIHGYPLTSAMWEKQATFLVEHGLRVITYDRRGFGRSAKPWNGYDYNTFADDLKELLDRLDLHDAGLVGFSMGGGEVVRYLSRHGAGRVSRAVLLSAVPPFLLQTGDNPEGIPAEAFEAFEQQLRSDRITAIASLWPDYYGHTPGKPTVSDAVLNWTQSMAMEASLRASLRTAQAWATTDFREEMKAIAVPFLVIHGTGDTTVPAALAGRRSASILPHARYSEFEGEPHGIFWTAAERVNRELLEFLA